MLVRLRVAATSLEAVIGLIGTLIVGALTTIAGSGLVGPNGVSILNLVITLVPIVVGIIINFLKSSGA